MDDARAERAAERAVGVRQIENAADNGAMTVGPRLAGVRRCEIESDEPIVANAALDELVQPEPCTASHIAHPIGRSDGRDEFADERIIACPLAAVAERVRQARRSRR